MSYRFLLTPSCLVFSPLVSRSLHAVDCLEDMAERCNHKPAVTAAAAAAMAGVDLPSTPSDPGVVLNPGPVMTPSASSASPQPTATAPPTPGAEMSGPLKASLTPPGNPGRAGGSVVEEEEGGRISGRAKEAGGRRSARRVKARLLRRQGKPELARPSPEQLAQGEGVWDSSRSVELCKECEMEDIPKTGRVGYFLPRHP